MKRWVKIAPLVAAGVALIVGFGSAVASLYATELNLDQQQAQTKLVLDSERTLAEDERLWNVRAALYADLNRRLAATLYADEPDFTGHAFKEHDGAVGRGSEMHARINLYAGPSARLAYAGMAICMESIVDRRYGTRSAGELQQDYLQAANLLQATLRDELHGRPEEELDEVIRTGQHGFFIASIDSSTVARIGCGQPDAATPTDPRLKVPLLGRWSSGDRWSSGYRMRRLLEERRRGIPTPTSSPSAGP